MTSIGQTRASTKAAESEEIERLTKKFLEDGGKIQRHAVNRGAHVDTWRHYAAAAMEDAK